MGNNKKALQEVEKVLKKTPNLRTGIALKALALIRLGKEKESTVLMDELEKEYPDEEATLQVMTYWYRETDQCNSQNLSHLISTLLIDLLFQWIKFVQFIIMQLKNNQLMKIY